MNIQVLLIGVTLVTGCSTVNVSQGWGKHGPDKDTKWESSEDTQESTDSINELSSRISGIDKSNQEIQKDIHKTSETQQQQVQRDEAIDKLNPKLPKDQRKKLYKDN